MATMEVVPLTDELPREHVALPTEIEEADALRLEKLTLERDLIMTQMQLLDAQRASLQEKLRTQTESGNALGMSLRTKYLIADGDRVDIAARKIERK